MISLIYNKNFLKSVKRLPKNPQAKLAKKLELPKPLTGPLVGFYSFRITRDWRVIFQFENPKVIKLIEMGHRKDIYR